MKTYIILKSGMFKMFLFSLISSVSDCTSKRMRNRDEIKREREGTFGLCEGPKMKWKSCKDNLTSFFHYYLIILLYYDIDIL